MSYSSYISAVCPPTGSKNQKDFLVNLLTISGMGLKETKICKYGSLCFFCFSCMPYLCYKLLHPLDPITFTFSLFLCSNNLFLTSHAQLYYYTHTKIQLASLLPDPSKCSLLFEGCAPYLEYTFHSFYTLIFVTVFNV